MASHTAVAESILEKMAERVLADPKQWFQGRRNLQKGDVVLVIEPHATRREWLLGRITETYPGADGLVRVVKVRYGGREYLRPISRLCPLEYVDQDK